MFSQLVYSEGTVGEGNLILHGQPGKLYREILCQKAKVRKIKEK